MNNLTSGIGYSGEVTAKLAAFGSTKVYFKNDGFKPLWNILAKAVTGYDVSDSVPEKLGIYFRSSTTNIDQPVLFSPIRFMGKVWGNVVDNSETSTSALFTATVTYGDRSYTVTESLGTVVLKMLDSKNNVLAEVVDNSNHDLAKIHNAMIAGVDAVYEWKLIFTNMPKAEVRN